MRATDFVAKDRPQLARIRHFPAVQFADYERRLAAMQGTLQLVQQSYLGTTHRAARTWWKGRQPTARAGT
jgi:hypothetical protein